MITHFAVLTVSHREYCSTVHANILYTMYRYPCGANPRYAGGYFTPRNVDCRECLDSAEYQEVITAIEVGFDGNQEAWWEAVKKQG